MKHLAQFIVDSLYEAMHDPYDDMDEFTQGYVDAALFSSTDDDGEPLDSGQYDLSQQAIERMSIDAKEFQEKYADLLRGLDLRTAGHKLWLTRNRHGTGFWDWDSIKDEEIKKKLTQAAHSLREVDLYVGDDGLVHASNEVDMDVPSSPEDVSTMSPDRVIHLYNQAKTEKNPVTRAKMMAQVRAMSQEI
jgi:hypothetical protein